MGLLDYISNEEERAKLTRGLLDAINRGAVGGLIGAPVDIANMALRPVGLGSDHPVMGSEWIGEKMQQAGMVSDQRNHIAEGLAGFVDPGTLAPVAMKAAAYGAPLLAALGATAIGSKASEGAKFSALANALPGQRGATAWHGSPHLFDKFKSEAIGTGQGAQTYGHGLYLAESPEVAQGYKYLNERSTVSNEADRNWINKFAEGDTDKALMLANRNLARHTKLGDKGGIEGDLRRIEGIKAVKAETNTLYKTDIPDAHIEKMLDWDKPLSNQHETIKKQFVDFAFKPGSPYEDYIKTYNPTPEELLREVRGSQFYNVLAGKPKHQSYLPNAPEASQTLSAAGIPGIKYLDGSSRTAGEGTRNFVMFNPDDIRILERNGQPTGQVPWNSEGLLDSGIISGIENKTANHAMGNSLDFFIERARSTLPTKNEAIIQKKAQEWYQNSLKPKESAPPVKTEFDAYDAIEMVGHALYGAGYKVHGASEQSASVYYKNPATGKTIRLSDHHDRGNTSRMYDRPDAQQLFNPEEIYSQSEIDEIVSNILGTP